MALPKEPRQKMINIMYLVLTAMLAINVSAEILNAFKTVNNSLETTNAATTVSTNNVFVSLTEKMQDSKTAEKAKVWQPKAKQVIDYTADAYNYIDGLKKSIITAAGGNPNDPTKSFKEDNLDIATRILITEGKAKEMFAKLEQFKKNVLDKVATPELKASFEQAMQINTETPKQTKGGNKSREDVYFHMVPTVAALTILSKFQNDLKTSENKLVTLCHEQVGKVDLKFDAFEAIVGQNSKYLMPGQELEITAGLGAFSKAKLPEVSIGGAGVKLNEKGMAVYKMAAGAVGAHTVNVTVKFTDQDGKPQERTIPVEYMVGQANASIALDKMNVLYIGVENPVTIAASGGGDDKTAVTITGGGGSIKKLGGGKYVATVTTVTEDCRINVSVDGKAAGASPFRVRTIPNASAFIGSWESGTTAPANQFRVQSGVGAGIRNFPFELKYQVTSFSMSIDTPEGDIKTAQCQGNTFNANARTFLNQYCQSGATVTIDEIRVLGPDGKNNKAPSLVYYIR